MEGTLGWLQAPATNRRWGHYPRKGRSYFPRADYRFVTWLQAGSGKIQWFIEVAGLPLRKSGCA